MTQHTPGPWVAEDNMSNEHKGKGWIVRGADGKPLMGWGSITTTEANARIMAAAPDLLAACEYVINMDWHGIGAPHVYEQLRAAIAKAKGEV